MPDITMPQLSDTMTEGTVVKWHKKEGDKVREGEKLADVETDKAVMEMEAFDSGTLTEIRVKEGQKAPVGAVLAVIGSPSEKSQGPSKPASPQSQKPSPPPQTRSEGVGADGASARDTEL